MPDDCTALSVDLLTEYNPAIPVAFHNQQYIQSDAFHAAVSRWTIQLQAELYERYALFTDDAYPFAVLLFALFHAGKEAWIPGNNRPGTAQQLQQQGCQLIGDWGNSHKQPDYDLVQIDSSTLTLSSLNPVETKLVIFTSGSTGQPKPIEKRLIQLQNEIAVLEQRWGKQLGNSEVLSTVSHQHIYGLLFRVLWPLSAGRCFHSQIYLNPEILVNSINNGSACWVASPAHLKRLDQDSPWEEIKELSAIFSSGGALPPSARSQIQIRSGQQVNEIYGSSETGGIGWRQQYEAWTLFPCMSLKEIDNSWRLRSPYLYDDAYYPIDDELVLLDDDRFILQGRSDRIVKIEEKRLSLSELEQRLCENSFASEAFVQVIHESRDVIAAVMVLTKQGLDYQKTQGRNALIKQLRNSLQQWFEPVVLPRKWLFADAIPLTAQGKIDQTLLTSLLQNNGKKLPKILSLKSTTQVVELELKVPQVQDLIYFPDHFQGFPILPGVVQLAWVEHYGKLFFSLEESAREFSRLEVVKFIQIIRPGDELTLTLNWEAESGELCFNFSSDSGGCSSGRMMYKCRDLKSCISTNQNK
jgi:acyl-CoA synthetase (AMP-forming)/AMP-acid ligase II/3-hydroxymyristoyl/3-hydroxydecanoyl-(acyl carrier protein) dehydratase